MDLDEVASELYALPREDFTPARNDRVKAARAAGERELATAIGRLRRPTLAAWLVNQLARRRPDQPHELAELGAALRSAHEQLDGAALRRLSGQRRDLVAALVQSCRALGEEVGVAVSDAVGRELEDMFTAAMADPDAARALASGRLSSPNELADAGALPWPAIAPDTSPRPAPAPPRTATPTPIQTPAPAPPPVDQPSAAQPSPAVLRARHELDAVTAALAEAEQQNAAAQQSYAEAAAEEAAAHQAVADRRAELIAAEQAERDARQRARTARRTKEDTDRAVRNAQRRRVVAQERLAALET